MTKPLQPETEVGKTRSRRRMDLDCGLDLDLVLRRMAEIESAFPDLGLRPIVLTNPSRH